MALRKIQIISIVVTFFVVAIFCFGYFPRGSFALGIKIGGVDVGGLSLERGKKKLAQETEKFLQKEVVFFYSKDGNQIQEKISLKEIGLQFDIEKSIEKPFKLGKEGNFFEDLKVKIKALFGKYNFPLVPFFSDRNEFENFLGSNFGQYETLPQNAQIVFKEDTLDFEIIPPKVGLMFPVEEIKEEIKNEVKFLKVKMIELYLKEKKPQIEEEDLKDPLRKAQALLKVAPLKLKANGQEVFLKKEVLGSLIEFVLEKEGGNIFYNLGINKEVVQNYLYEISEKINIPPENPILGFEDGKIKIISPPKKGKVLDIQQSTEVLREKILLKEKEIELKLKEVDPEITEEKLQDLKIEILLGKGESNFSGSPKNRIHNIKKASTKVSGILVAPGEEFSFNKTLGPTGPEEGYLPELVIKPRKTILEYGGGVCQVSTTLFRAAVHAGLEIIQRHPHSYPVRYYGTPGFDATVYYPFPDLRFKNNSPEYILIQLKIEDKNLIYEIYGQNDKRETKVNGPFVLEVKGDGSIKARLDQEVWKEGKLFLRKSFFSNYKPAAAYPVFR